MNKLRDKVAVVYGDGNTGSAIAKAFVREGARVFLAGRTGSKLQKIADEIKSSGGQIEIEKLDALDETEVANHLDKVVKKEGSVDISFNAIGLPQKVIQGLPLAELSVESFMLPLITCVKSHFITAKAAVKQMMQQGGGVILMHTPNASRISAPFVGGMIPAWSAIEALCRSLSVESGEKGIRSVCLLTTGMPETTLIDEVWEIHGKAHGITYEQFNIMIESATHRKKLTTLAEFTNAAVFAASDEGSGITGTIFNLTSGMIVY